MKKLFIVFVFLILTNFDIYPQSGWFWQNPLLQGNDLNCVKFFNVNTGWIVGEYGTILKTTNAGINWIKQYCSSTQNIYSVFPVSELNVFIACDSGTILQTTNGGNNWTACPNLVNSNLRSIYFVNNQLGFIAGETGTILKTSNGGNNWEVQNSNRTNSLYSIYFKDVQTGWAAGYGGIIIKTTNSGVNWNIQDSGWVTYSSICFLNNLTGFIVSKDISKYRMTTDGGNYWRFVVSW